MESGWRSGPYRDSDVHKSSITTACILPHAFCFCPSSFPVCKTHFTAHTRSQKATESCRSCGARALSPLYCTLVKGSSPLKSSFIVFNFSGPGRVSQSSSSLGPRFWSTPFHRLKGGASASGPLLPILYLLLLGGWDSCSRKDRRVLVQHLENWCRQPAPCMHSYALPCSSAS